MPCACDGKNVYNIMTATVNNIFKVKYLIIRFSSIGDIVLTTPVIRGLKQQVEGAEIHFLTKKKYEGILQHNPYIDKVYAYDHNMPELIQHLKQEDYHYVIDLHRNIRSAMVKSRIKALPFSFNKINWQKWLMVNAKINKLPDIHIVDRYLDTLKLFDVHNDRKGLDYFLSENDIVSSDALPEDFRKGYIAFAIGGQHYTKKLPAELIMRLLQLIDYPVVLLGGKDDIPVAEHILQHSGTKRIVNACNQYSLNQSAFLLKQSRLVITHDTGLMHIAAAFKKTVISLWGNTIPAFGMSPYMPDKNSKIFEVNNLSCRPCSKIGHRKCPKGHFRCMRDMPLKEIAGYVISVLRD